MIATPAPGLPRGQWVDPPVMPLDPDELPAELPRGGDIPDNLDPFEDGVLMEHQADWIADDSILKVCEKGRRTGITFAEALDCTLIAAAQRSGGGQNVFYIPDSKPKGREFVGYCAHFAKTVAKEMLTIEDGIFFDIREDGSTQAISSYIIRFASGFRIEALSSRPENIRGLQGTVVIDEAAFHRDVFAVLDAVSALLIWGGKIRIISSHNGMTNPFNELIKEARAGKNGYSVHTYTFGDAVKNGLYKRVCLIKGEDWSQEEQDKWEATIRKAYGTRTAKMRQELDAIAAEAEGAALTSVLIESCMRPGIPVVRWACSDDFKMLPEEQRTEQTKAWLKKEVAPLLARLNPRRQHVFGEDFGRKGDATAIMPMEIGQDMVRRVPFVVELHNVPFDQQREILFFVVDGLPRLAGGALDSGGNGAYLAEKAAQRYGSKVIEVKFSEAWYKTEMAAYVMAFSDKLVLLPFDIDIRDDHQALAYVRGYIKVPDDYRTKGSDGYDRHGDTAIAGALAYFASRADLEAYEYTPTRKLESLGGTPMFEAPSMGGLIPNISRGLH